MKKTIKLFGLLMIAGAMVFTSCSKDEDEDPVDNTPVITFMGGADYTSADATMITGAAFKVGINASENPTTTKNLESFKVVRTFNNVPVEVYFEDGIGAATYAWDMDVEANAEVGVERWTFTITDKDGLMKELVLNITTEAGTHDLSDPMAMEWQRVAGAAGTGLDMFGLKWTSNGKEVMAQIEKDMAEKFVSLTADEWTSIMTMEDLAAAIEAGTDMDVYTGVSAEQASATYDDVLATKYNDMYYIIHITASTVVVETAGTTITITGEYKN